MQAHSSTPYTPTGSNDFVWTMPESPPGDQVVEIVRAGEGMWDDMTDTGPAAQNQAVTARIGAAMPEVIGPFACHCLRCISENRYCVASRW